MKAANAMTATIIDIILRAQYVGIQYFLTAARVLLNINMILILS